METGGWCPNSEVLFFFKSTSCDERDANHIRRKAVLPILEKPRPVGYDMCVIPLSVVPPRNGCHDVSAKYNCIEVQSVVENVVMEYVALRVWDCEKYATILHLWMSQPALVEHATAQAIQVLPAQ